MNVTELVLSKAADNFDIDMLLQHKLLIYI